jgi:lipid-binding SYLF domain-containing protein
MTQGLSPRTGGYVRKSTLPLFLISVFALLLALPAWAGDKEKDEETLKNAASVLREAIDGGKIPTSLLDEAKCVIVLPNVKKFGIGVGGSGGRGALTCRSGKDFEGKWSAPAMYTIGGASVGLQVGGTSTDFVLLVMGDKGVQAVLQDKTKLGSDATAAAGPSGATTASTSVGGVDVLTYAKAKGLFAGVSLDGATLHADADANQRLYGKPISGREIVRGNAVKAPPGGQPLISLLDSKLPKHGGSKAKSQ